MLRSPAVRVPDAVLQQIDLNKVLATAATAVVTSGITAAITWTFTSSS